MRKRLLLLTCALLACQGIFAYNPAFLSPEHMTIGDNVKLTFPNHPQGEYKTLLHLENGLALTYGEIVTLSGDFYGVVEAPIALGKTPAEQKQRFANAYATLATDQNAVSESGKLLALIHSEAVDIQQGIDQGENPTAIYARVNPDYNIQWNCITGGLCPADYPGIPHDVFRKIYVLKQGRYLRLADTDFDHFNVQAWDAYKAGHTLAIETAIQAQQKNDVASLEKAYAINAFACHFLSDSFAPGHMRAPRVELYFTVFTPTIGSILSSYMHNEENKAGLVLTNRRGDAWKAYGDYYYLDERNQKNRALLQEAMQTSADEIYSAFSTGREPAEDNVFALIPDLDKLSNPDARRNNISPLFYWDAQYKVVMRRIHINDTGNYEWTPFWLGWETLLELLNSTGLPNLDQAALLADPATREYALKQGLITDKDILQFYQSYHSTLKI